MAMYQQARGQVLGSGGKNTFLGGLIVVFIGYLKQTTTSQMPVRKSLGTICFVTMRLAFCTMCDSVA